MKNSFPKSERLKSKQDFEEIFKQGKRISAKLFRVYYLNKYPRKLGVIVSKKVSKSAVRRNKIKRWIREIYRTNKYRIPDDVRIVVVALAQAEKSSFNEVSEDILQVFDRINNFAN
jgi:ribonuclease P protein component